MTHKTFSVIGGDTRSAYLAAALIRDGHTVYVNALEACGRLPEEALTEDVSTAIRRSDVVILPMPLSADEVILNAPLAHQPVFLADLFAAASPHQLFVAGKVKPRLAAALKLRHITLLDYMQREELAIMNSIPTAEGALELAMRLLPVTLFGCKTLVIGYGRIGKLLSANLRDLGASVTVSARKQADFAWIRANRMTPADSTKLTAFVGGFDLIFNTAPAMMLEEAALGCCKPEVLIIDLASVPGGVDFAVANQLGRKAVAALSLPGKVAPQTAAGIVKDTIINMISEETP